MRTSHIERRTKETEISLDLNLDGSGNNDIQTGIGFFDHMLDLFSFHGNFDISLQVTGDLDVDDHHTIEDVGIALGDAFAQAIGDKHGITRYGSFTIPMDESLAQVDLDISGRSYLVFHAEFNREQVGMMATEMVEEFFRAFATHAGVTLHINLAYGKNDHHKIEAIFKAFGHALMIASEVTSDRLVSTKGLLE